MPIRDILRSAASLFVELPPEKDGPGGERAPSGESMPPEKIADLLRELPEPQLAVGAPADLPADPATIYQLAGVPAAACPIEEVAALIDRHRDFDRQTARKAVAAALEFRPGAVIRDILTDGAAKLQALQAYEEAAQEDLSRLETVTAQQAEAIRARTEQTVLELERQIEEARRQAEEEVAAAETALEARREAQARLEESLREEATRLHETLDFLTPDTPPAPGEGVGSRV